MSVRTAHGAAFRLRVPSHLAGGQAGSRLRPTTGKVKEWIFSQVDVVGKKGVSDLFAGSGSLGIEALYEGAAHVTFVDKHSAAVRAIRENLASLGLAGDARVLRRDVLRYLESLSEGCLEVALADPPYEYRRLSALLPAVARTLCIGGLFILEHSTHTGPFAANSLELIKEKRFGGTTVSIFRRASPTVRQAE